MSRSLEPQKASNPALRFLEWKSNDKKFRFYNKEAKSNEFVELPFKFMKLKEFHTVKGFHDHSQSSIFSNEVEFIGKEELNVRSFKGGDIVKGIYKEVKGDIISAGGHYAKSIYIMTPNFEIWNLQLKGSGAGAWGEFSNEMRKRLNDEWIEVKTFEAKEKGVTKYTVPVFTSNNSLSDEEWEKAKENFEILKKFFDNRSNLAKNESKESNIELPPLEGYQEFPDEDITFEQGDLPC